MHLLLVMTYSFRNLVLFLMVLVGLSIVAPNGLAQSSDQSLPTPVLTNEISGKIRALDMGDPRSTRHYYAFEGSPGDLLITIVSKNLNGDIDVFTAVTFRPLMKTSVYASSQSGEVTKGIYLRTHQILILRVEARTPSDEPGTYQIRFGGTFERFSGGIPVAEASSTESEETGERSGANRLSSVGATIPRPPGETIETPEAKPSPSPEKAAEETKTAARTTSNTARRTTSKPPPRRGSRPAPTRPATSTKKTEPAKAEAEVAKTEPEKPAEEKAAVTEKPAETSTSAEKPRAQEVSPGARLIIEAKDGTKIERPMSTVRRVVIEGSAIVIILKTGKIERIAMSNVARMAIEPQ